MFERRVEVIQIRHESALHEKGAGLPVRSEILHVQKLHLAGGYGVQQKGEQIKQENPAGRWANSWALTNSASRSHLENPDWDTGANTDSRLIKPSARAATIHPPSPQTSSRVQNERDIQRGVQADQPASHELADACLDCQSRDDVTHKGEPPGYGGNDRDHRPACPQRKVCRSASDCGNEPADTGGTCLECHNLYSFLLSIIC